MRRHTLIATPLLAFALLGADAHAQGCQAAPGTAAVDQYCESVPAAGGSQGGDGAGSKGSASGGGATPSSPQTVPPSTADAIEADGATGEALGKALEASGATPAPTSGRDQRPADEPAGAPVRRQASTTPAEPSGNPLTAVSEAATDGAVLGGPLVWALLGVAVIGLGAGLVRARPRA